MAGYNFEIEYIRWSDKVIDALSRVGECLDEDAVRVARSRRH